MEVAVAIHPFGRSGGAERLATLHAIGLSAKGHRVAFYTDVSTLDRSWLAKLRESVEVRNLPYGLKGRLAVREMRTFETILVHHHVEPITAFNIASQHGDRTCWYVGEPLRAIWEAQLTGADYRQFSPTVFDTAKHFYGNASTIALSPVLYPLTTSIVRILDRMTARRYGTIIANSHYSADLVRKILDYKKPIPVVYPASGLPSSMFKPDYGNGDYVLSVGALMPNKNHRILFEAMSTIQDPPPIHVIGQGQEKDSLRRLARRLGIRIEFFPRVTDEQLRDTYERCLFVVISSLLEPFGMTALEAAFAGKPSVVCEMGGAKEFVVNGETGLVVDPTQGDALATALQLLIENKQMRNSMGRKARERAFDRFTLERSVESLVRAMNS